MESFFDGLAKQGLTAILEVALMGVLAGAAALFARNWVRRGKVWVKGDEGHTCMSPMILLIGLLCAAMAAACLVLGFLNPESFRERGDFIAWAGLVGGFSLAFLLILPFTRHAWDWDREGLTWSGAWRSVSIPWPDIARAGKRWDGQCFVADARGRKIYWSPYTLEHEALREAIARRRPDITIPAP
jgi:uncharacterized membrane protein